MTQESRFEELLTVHELATFLKVPISWVYRHCREQGEGTLPRVRAGRHVRFPKDEVVAWLRKGSKEGP